MKWLIILMKDKVGIWRKGVLTELFVCYIIFWYIVIGFLNAPSSGINDFPYGGICICCTNI